MRTLAQLNKCRPDLEDLQAGSIRLTDIYQSCMKPNVIGICDYSSVGASSVFRPRYILYP